MQLGIGPSISKVATTMRTFGVQFIKDNLKLFFDFKNTDLENVGTGSVNFDGSSDYVNLGSPSTGTGTKTISMWVKPNTVTSDDRIISNIDSPNFSIRFGSSDVEVWGGSWVSLFTNPSASVWTHFAFVFNGSTNVIGYKDGVAGSSVSTNYDFSNLGLGATFQLTHGNYFDGNIAQVAIWDRALSASEIQNIIYKTVNDLQGTELTHLIAWYPLDNSSDTYNNSHSSSYHGTNNGTELKDGIYGNNSPRKPRGVDNSSAALADQIGNGSAYFVTTGESTEDYIDCGDGAHTGEGKDTLTFTSWIKHDPDKSDSFGRIAGKGHDDSWQIMIDESGVAMSIAIYINNNLIQTSSNAIEANVWHHVAFTYDKDAGSGTCLIYIDGVLVHSDTSAGGGNTIGTNDHSLIIGADEDTTTQGWGGYIAQVGLWERVLTQEEIQSVKEKTYSELTTTEKLDILCYYGLDSLHGQNAVEDKNGTESLGSEIVDNGEFTGTFDTTQDYGSDFDLVTGWRVHTAGSGGSPHTATEGDNNGSQAVRIISTSSLSTNYINVRSKVAITLTEGILYKLTFDAKKESTQTFMRIKTASGANIAYQPVAGGLDAEVTLTDTMTTYTYYFRPTVTDTTSYIAFGRKSGDSASNFTIDNISLKSVTGSNVGVLI